MYVDVLDQALVFGQGFLLGAALGLVYDGMRTLRRSLKLAALAFLLDLLFWIGAAASLFAFTLLRDDGQVRIFHMAAAVLGGAISSPSASWFCPFFCGWPVSFGPFSGFLPPLRGGPGGPEKNF